MSADLLFDAPASDSTALVFGGEAAAQVGASPNLVFRDAPATNGDLVFVADPIDVEEPISQTSTVTVNAALPSLQSAGVLRVGTQVTCAAPLPNLSGVGALRFGVHVSSVAPLPVLVAHGAVTYFVNVQRPTVGSLLTSASVAVVVETGITQGQQHARATAAGVSTAFQQATASGVSTAVPFTDAQRFARADVGRFAEGVLFRSLTAANMQEGDPSLRFSQDAKFQDAAREQSWPKQQRFQDGLRDRRPQAQGRAQEANRSGRRLGTKGGHATPRSHARHSPFQESWVPRPGIYVRPVVPVVPREYWGTALLFACPPIAAPHLVFGAQQCAPEPVAIPIRKVYIVINNITLHRIDTGAELHAHSFSMSLDYQSWTWSWSASLHDDAAPHLGRDSQGDPAELIAQVNGTPFRLRLVSVGRDRRFNPTRWSVSGQGKAAILAAPWAPTLSFGNPTAARTAQQLTADALTINGAGIGWTVDWGLQDWQVPAGAWAMQGSYIDAINDIAASVGGYVQPHATDSVLRILPRYPDAPWTWASITPDFEIPEDAAEVEGTQYIDRCGYNRVFVGGVGAGVFGPLTRAGTAGNVIAPQVTHALITDATAHRQRGIAELSDTGKQEHITLTMQVLPETGVIVPGQFVRYLGDIPALGIVRSTSIDWSRPKLRQTIRLETHV